MGDTFLYAVCCTYAGLGAAHLRLTCNNLMSSKYETAQLCRFSAALQQVTANLEDTLWVKLDDCNIHESKAKRVRCSDTPACSPCAS